MDPILWISIVALLCGTLMTYLHKHIGYFEESLLFIILLYIGKGIILLALKLIGG